MPGSGWVEEHLLDYPARCIAVGRQIWIIAGMLGGADAFATICSPYVARVIGIINIFPCAGWSPHIAPNVTDLCLPACPVLATCM